MGEDEVNYCFLSKGKMTTNQPDETAYLIYIYQPPRGDAVVGDIKQVEPSMSS
jgi:exosome complex RNA-binding protein Rrp4